MKTPLDDALEWHKGIVECALAEMPFLRQLTFAVWCSQYFYRDYLRFYEVERAGGPDVVTEVLKFAWMVAAGGTLDADAVAKLAEQIKSVDTGEDGATDWPSRAFDCLVVADSLLDLMATKNITAAASCGNQMIEDVYEQCLSTAIGDRNVIHPEDWHELHRRIKLDPRLDAVIQKQLNTLNAIEQEATLTKDFVQSLHDSW
jgi:hypothetical protein